MSSWTRATGRAPTHSTKKKKRAVKKKTYPFPILDADEITACMHDLDMDSCTVDKVSKAKPAFAKTVYECLAEYCMSVTREQMNQADFTSLEAMDGIQNPELHEQSIPKVTYFRYMTKLMSASQINDFSLLEDVIRPNPTRFIRNVSAIINFAKFREERLETHNEMTARTAELVEEKEKRRFSSFCVVCFLTTFSGVFRHFSAFSNVVDSFHDGSSVLLCFPAFPMVFETFLCFSFLNLNMGFVFFSCSLSLSLSHFSPLSFSRQKPHHRPRGFRLVFQWFCYDFRMVAL